ncbi:hypothetical protein VNO77_03125 [Canavalia gladiata]|uniref:Uncharacterized protein n=1 Tax=Canavalia gladiata TaxID=3824 RepID=A0AAN9MZ59_CANGL
MVLAPRALPMILGQTSGSVDKGGEYNTYQRSISQSYEGSEEMMSYGWVSQNALHIVGYIKLLTVYINFIGPHHCPSVDEIGNRKVLSACVNKY